MPEPAQVEDKNKNTWLHSESRNFQAIFQPDEAGGTPVIYKKSFPRIPDVQVNAIYLDPGLYTFLVRGQNVYGHLGSEAIFQFKILLPRYRT